MAGWAETARITLRLCRVDWAATPEREVFYEVLCSSSGSREKEKFLPDPVSVIETNQQGFSVGRSLGPPPITVSSKGTVL